VIYIIRNSPDLAAARNNLMRGHEAYLELSKSPPDARIIPWSLTEIQAREVLDMRLARLTGLERQKIVDELLAVKKVIADLENLLGPHIDLERLDRLFEIIRAAADEETAGRGLIDRLHYSPAVAPEVIASFKRRLGVIREELLQIREEYADERRTELVDESGDFRIEDMIAEEEVVITVTRAGYIKRFPVSGYRRQRRGGKGLSGHAPREEDVVQHLFVASTHNYLLFFTDNGRCYWLKVHEIPSLGRAARGKPIINLIDIQPGEKIGAMVNVEKFDDENFVLFATRKGIVKKTPLSAYGNPRKSGIIAINIDEDDSLAGVDLTDGTCDIVLGASNGKAVRFRESDIPPHGRASRGVIGMRIASDEKIVGMVVARREGTLLVCALNGNGKKSPLHEYRLTKRGAQGVIAMRTTPHTGPLIALMEVTDADDLLIITTSGMVIRQNVDKLRTIGRVTQGVRLIRLEEDDKIQDIARVVRETETGDEEGGDDGDMIGEEQTGLFEG
jgi:DNA gyrase subunit A